MTTNLSVNAINEISATKTETVKGQKTNAYLLNQQIKDSVEISSNKNDKKENVYTATKKFAELTKNKSYAGVMSNLKFAKYYAQDKIDISTVEKLADKTDFSIDSMSRVYTTGKGLNDSKFADKIMEKAVEYNKKDISKGGEGVSSAIGFHYNEEKSTYGIIHKEGEKNVFCDVFDAKTDKLVKTIDRSGFYENNWKSVGEALDKESSPYFL